jgi:hypothetical protein
MRNPFIECAGSEQDGQSRPQTVLGRATQALSWSKLVTTKADSSQRVSEPSHDRSPSSCEPLQLIYAN